MFFSCPHCRELVATDRETRLPPLMCPRCGGVLREESNDANAALAATDSISMAGSRSIASFLRGDEPTVETGSASPTPIETDANDINSSAPKTGATDSAFDDAEFDDADIVQAETPEAIAVAIEQSDDTNAEIATPEMQPAFAPVAADATAPATTAQSPSTPSFTRQPVRPALPTRTMRWQWAITFLLALTLLIQVLVADRNSLAADANWRPLITRMCATLGCSVPAWHQPGAFTMLSREVRPLGGIAGGLQVQASFRNDARWSQAWPVLVLSLSDADGRTVGERAFTSSEYLGADATQKELGAGQSAQIAVQLHEPNPDVVAFSFEFR
jgi:hypothetical protein